MTKAQLQAQTEARDQLRGLVRPGSEVYTIIRSVARSGMQRDIGVVVMEEGRPHDITWLASRALGYRMNKNHSGLVVRGCGMDMGFAVVYELGHALFSDGFDCVGERCPSNDHSNGDRDYTPHRHSSGGYALRQRWL